MDNFPHSAALPAVLCAVYRSIFGNLSKITRMPLHVESDNPTYQQPDLSARIHYLTLDLMVKEAYIEELQVENFALKRCGHNAPAVSNEGTESVVAALRQELQSANERLHEMWVQKNREIDDLKKVLSQRASLLAPLEAVAEAAARERALFEDYRTYMAAAQGITAEPESVRAAIRRTVTMTCAAAMRRLRRVRR